MSTSDESSKKFEESREVFHETVMSDDFVLKSESRQAILIVSTAFV
jgi:hypothetical protein